MKIAFLITTYNRPDLLSLLIDDILAEQKNHSIALIIADDASKESYRQVYDKLEKCTTISFILLNSQVHHGKQHYYKLINRLFFEIKNKTFDYYIQLPDDVRLVAGFFDKAIYQFNHINDPRKVCLNILNDFSRKGPIWVGYTPHEFGHVIKTGWMDMCYIANTRFFKTLNYSVKVDESFSSKPGLSSGVGMEISKNIFSKKLGMYQVKKSLVKHGFHKSVMHMKHREKIPLISNHEHVTANVASIPQRAKALEEMVKSIINQVDELNVFLNNYLSVPAFLKNPKIKVFRSQDYGDMGDVGKFFAYNLWKPGYIFTMDDDLVYFPGYVNKLVIGIEKYEKKAVVSLHGRRFTQLPIHSYYHANCTGFRCLGSHPKDEPIHIPGTGVLAFHTDTILPKITDFKAINMADIWIGILCQKKSIPVVMLAHEAGWVKDSPHYDHKYTIYEFLKNKDKVQTDAVNSTKWILHKI